MSGFRLGEDRLTPAILHDLVKQPNPNVTVTPGGMARVRQFRGFVETVLDGTERIYGINTGFGYLANVAIDHAKLAELQVNLVRSHACGVGERVPNEIVRGLLILRAHTFVLGHSGVRAEVVAQILAFLTNDILPVIPAKGSVGASGDLAPLAHLAMGLMGEGKVCFKGQVRLASDVLKECGIAPLELAAKEGLALINGTQFMTVIAALAVEEAQRLAKSADVISALSLDAVRGSLRAFDPRIQAVRPQPGQSLVALNIRALFPGGDDGIMRSHEDCDKVQDPYSFRCIPQVHGATRDVLGYVSTVVETELNSITDNPLVFSDADIISGGNFHGQPIAMAMDFLGIAIAEIGSISERRIEKITNPHLSGLPAFATKNGGLNSGFMIPHVVSAALVSENKILAHPASVDSIPTSADKEDHVSMGPIAARKAREIIRNVSHILAIEALSATQGLDLLKPLEPSAPLAAVFSAIRGIAPMMETDRSLHQEIEDVSQWILGDGPSEVVKSTGIALQ